MSYILSCDACYVTEEHLSSTEIVMKVPAREDLGDLEIVRSGVPRGEGVRRDP